MGDSLVHVNFDHAHIFASNLPATIGFFQEMLGGEIVWDEETAGARTVRLAIGKGFVPVYDQAPHSERPGNIHHLGVETDDLEALVVHMQNKGYEFRHRGSNGLVF